MPFNLSGSSAQPKPASAPPSGGFNLSGGSARPVVQPPPPVTSNYNQSLLDDDPITSTAQTMKSALDETEPKYISARTPGNIDLAARVPARMPDGSIATVRSKSFEFDGKEVLLPTVSDDGKLMSDKETIEQYRKTGKHLGIFDSIADANNYAEQLHRDQAELYRNSQPGKRGPGMFPIDLSTPKPFKMHPSQPDAKKPDDFPGVGGPVPFGIPNMAMVPGPVQALLDIGNQPDAPDYSDVLAQTPTQFVESTKEMVAGMQARSAFESSKLLKIPDREKDPEGYAEWMSKLENAQGPNDVAFLFGKPNPTPKQWEQINSALQRAKDAEDKLSAADLPNKNILQRAISSTATSAPVSLGALLAGIASGGNPLVAAGAMVAPTAGQEFAGIARDFEKRREEEDAGILPPFRLPSAEEKLKRRIDDLQTASVHSGIRGLSGGLTELIPFAKMLRLEGGFSKRFFGEILWDIPGEHVDNTVGAISQAYLDRKPGESDADVIERGVVEAMKQFPDTVAASIVMGLTQSSIANMPPKAREALARRKEKKAYERLMARAEGNVPDVGEVPGFRGEEEPPPPPAGGKPGPEKPGVKPQVLEDVLEKEAAKYATPAEMAEANKMLSVERTAKLQEYAQRAPEYQKPPAAEAKAAAAEEPKVEAPRKPLPEETYQRPPVPADVNAPTRTPMSEQLPAHIPLMPGSRAKMYTEEQIAAAKEATGLHPHDPAYEEKRLELVGRDSLTELRAAKAGNATPTQMAWLSRQGLAVYSNIEGDEHHMRLLPLGRRALEAGEKVDRRAPEMPTPPPAPPPPPPVPEGTPARRESDERRAKARETIPLEGQPIAQGGEVRTALEAVRSGTPSPEQMQTLKGLGFAHYNIHGDPKLLPPGLRVLAKAEGKLVETKVQGRSIVVNVQPSDAQRAAGNYQKGHTTVSGIDIAIENPQGSDRKWHNRETGQRGTKKMPYHYGYVKGTEGADGDAVDVYVGPNEKAKSVFVVNQLKGDGSFDEHKAMLGFNNIEQAKAGYMRNFQPGWKGMGDVVEMSVDEFKEWTKNGDHKSPIKPTPTTPPLFSQKRRPSFLAVEVKNVEELNAATGTAQAHKRNYIFEKDGKVLVLDRVPPNKIKADELRAEGYREIVPLDARELLESGKISTPAERRAEKRRVKLGKPTQRILFSKSEIPSGWVVSTPDELAAQLKGGPQRKRFAIFEKGGKVTVVMRTPGFQGLRDRLRQSGHREISRPDAFQILSGGEAPKIGAVPSFKSDAFKSWFGDSQAVDAQGNPQVYYHATNSDFDSFRLRVGDIGIHFGTQEQANDRINYRGDRGMKPGEGPSVMPVYLSVQNPFRVTDQGAWNAENMFDPLFKAFPGDMERIRRLKSTKDVREYLQAKGYDGIVYKNTGESNDAEKMKALRAVTKQARADFEAAMAAKGKKFTNAVSAEDAKSPEYKRWNDGMNAEMNFRHGEGSVDSFAVFHPSQIKSATGNSGAFDPRSKNILFAKKPTTALLQKEFIGRDDEFWGITYDERFGSSFSDSDFSGVTCTGYACGILHRLGRDRVKVYGFHPEDNPSSAIAQKDGTGHDFAVVDGRFIVDPWLPEFSIASNDKRGVFDLKDPRDAAKIKEIYGDRAAWTDVSVKMPEGRSNPTESVAFQRWFGDSKITENGEPKVVYHGTTGDFDTFDLAKGTTEGNLGRGIYFSNNTEDVAANYAGFGPDLTAKLEESVEEVMRRLPDLTHEQAMEQVKKFHGVVTEGSTMPVYLRMEKPAILGGENPTFLDFEEEYDEAADDFKPPKGQLWDFTTNLRSAALGYYDMDMNRVVSELLMDARDNGGMSLTDIMEKLEASPDFHHISDENGHLVGSEVIRKAVEMTGFDGYIDHTVNKKFGTEARRMRPMEGVDEDTTHYVIFSNTQVKSAIGNRGTYDESGNILTSRKAPTFFSPVERFIAKHSLVRGSPAQWIASLKNAPGIKKEELAWLGIEDWLNKFGPTEKVERTAVTNFIQANSAKVTERVLGADVSTKTEEAEDELVSHLMSEEGMLSNDALEYADAVIRGRLTPAQIAAQSEETRELAKTLQNTALSQRGEKIEAKAEYGREGLRTPGGKNYRELLLTTPINVDHGMHIEHKPHLDYPWRVVDAQGHLNNAFETEERAERYLVQRSPGNYTGGHFTDTPNIVTWVRFDERTVNGERVLFIDEIQSDWHQGGRKQGYVPKDPMKALDKARAEHAAKLAAHGREWMSTSEYDQSVRNIARLTTGYGVPDAPFKTNWHELALKRMVRWAAEHEFDRIAWTTGAMQAHRYNLSTHAEMVEIQRQGEDSYDLLVKPRGGATRSVAIGMSNVELAEQVGDVMAEHAKRIAVGGYHEYFGTELEIGGEGMKGFYDDILVNSANKLGKKFGTKVDQIPIEEAGTGVFSDFKAFAREQGDDRLQSELLDAWKTDDPMYVAWRQSLASTVHSLKIPPAMKEGALAGQPFYSRSRTPARGMSIGDVNSIISKITRGYRKPNINVVTSPDKLPWHIYRAIRKEDPHGDLSDIDGLYHDGQIYLVSENLLNEAHAIDTIYHELVVHYGLREVMKPEDLEEIQDGIWRDMEKAVRDVAHRNGLDVEKLDERRLAAEEVMAYMAGKVVRGEALTEPEQTLWDKIIAALRRVLDSMGIAKYYDNARLAQVVLDSNTKLQSDSGAIADRLQQPAMLRSQKAPLWYSPMIREIEELKRESAAPDEWLEIIKSRIAQGKIREAEIKWTGIREWLEKATVGEILGRDPQALQEKDIPNEMRELIALRQKFSDWFEAAMGETPHNDDMIRRANALEDEYNKLIGADVKPSNITSYSEAQAELYDTNDQIFKILNVVSDTDDAKSKPLAFMRPLRIPKAALLDQLRREQVVITTKDPVGNKPLSEDRGIDAAAAEEPAEPELPEARWDNSDGEVDFDEYNARDNARNDLETDEVEEKAVKLMADNINDINNDNLTSDDFVTPEDWTEFQEALEAAGDGNHDDVKVDAKVLTDEALLRLAHDHDYYRQARDEWIDQRVESDREYAEENGARRFSGSYRDSAGTWYRFDATRDTDDSWTAYVDGDDILEGNNRGDSPEDILQLIREKLRDLATAEPAVQRRKSYKWEGYSPNVKKEGYRERLITWSNRTGDFSTFRNDTHYPSHTDFLAHTRVYETETADGKKILVLDELQSDWHQSIREAAVAKEEAVEEMEDQIVSMREAIKEYDSSLAKEGLEQAFVTPRTMALTLSSIFMTSGGATQTHYGSNGNPTKVGIDFEVSDNSTPAHKLLNEFLKTKYSEEYIQKRFAGIEFTPQDYDHDSAMRRWMLQEMTDRLVPMMGATSEFLDFLQRKDVQWKEDVLAIQGTPMEQFNKVSEYFQQNTDRAPSSTIGREVRGYFDNHLNNSSGITFMTKYIPDPDDPVSNRAENDSELGRTLPLIAGENLEEVVRGPHRDAILEVLKKQQGVIDQFQTLMDTVPEGKPYEDEMVTKSKHGKIMHSTRAELINAFNGYRGNDDSIRQFNHTLQNIYRQQANPYERTFHRLQNEGKPHGSRDIYADPQYKAEIENQATWPEETKEWVADLLTSLKEIRATGMKVRGDGSMPFMDMYSLFSKLGIDFSSEEIEKSFKLPVIDMKSHTGYISHQSAMSDATNGFEEANNTLTRPLPPSPPLAKTWPIAILQWAIREATENKLDGVAMTPGSVHGARWTATKSTDSIRIAQNPKEFLQKIRLTSKGERRFPPASRGSSTRMAPSFRLDSGYKGLDGGIVHVDKNKKVRAAVYGRIDGKFVDTPAQEIYGDKDPLVVLMGKDRDGEAQIIVTSKSRVPGWIGKFSGAKVQQHDFKTGEGDWHNMMDLKGEPGATVWWPTEFTYQKKLNIHFGQQEAYNAIMPNEMNAWLKKWKLKLEPHVYASINPGASITGDRAVAFEGLTGEEQGPPMGKFQLPTVMLNDEVKTQAMEKGFPLQFSRKWHNRAKNIANRVVQGGSNFDTPDPSSRSRAWNYLVFKMQDKFVDLFKTQQEAAAWHQTAQLPDQMDAYLQQTLFHGRTESSIKEHNEQFVEPLIEMIKKSGYSWEDVEDYLYARHAPEANAHLLKINNNNPKFNSGMSDNEAAQITTQLASRGDFTKLEDIGRHVDAMNQWTRNQMVMNGLEDAATIQEWENTYQHYVPLKGWKDQVNDPDVADLFGMPKKGKGFDTGGKLVKARTGRTSRAATILANVVAQAQATIILGEKAKVGRAFYEFVKQTPSSRLWSINEADKIRYVDPNTGLVREGPNPQAQLADNVIRVKIGGKTFHITLNDEIPAMRRIAEAMKNLSADQIGPVLSALHKVNRFLSSINTSLNPEFTVTNALRDLQTAFINLNEQDIDGIKRKILGGWRKAWWAIRRGEQQSTWVAKNHTAQWAKEWEEFKKEGGKVGWIDHYKSAVALDKVLQRMLGPNGMVQWTAHGIRRLGDFIENENLAVENALRLSTYVHLRDAGLTKERAAAYAKDLTVNFNRKGAAGTFINSLYLFYNAAAQGSARMFQAAKNPAVRKVMFGIMAAAMAREILNRMLGGDDDDDEPLYDKIPEGDKERNMIFMLPKEMRHTSPSGEKISYLKVPLPYGYNVIDYAGQKLGKLVDHLFIGNARRYHGPEEAAELVGSMIKAFSPFGDPSTSLGQFIAPTALDPLVQISDNKAWHGGKLMPEDFPGQPPKPDSQKFYRSTPAMYRQTAAALNRLGGGSTVTPGDYGTDISPETMQLLVETMTGGLGKFVEGAIDTAGKPNEELELRNVPFLRRVLGAVGDRQTQELFYDHLTQVGRAEQEIDAAYDLGIETPEGQAKLAYIEERYPVASKMIREAHPNFGDSNEDKDRGRRKVVRELKERMTAPKPSNAEPERRRGRRRSITSDLADAKRELARLDARTGLPAEEKRAKVEEQKKILRDLMIDFNKRWNHIEDSVYGERDSRKLIERLGPLINGKSRKDATSMLRQSGLTHTASLLASMPPVPDRFAREFFALEAQRDPT